ncbi:hypothetical protein HD806DRAFT_524603 [Xylariaceae sp. AK1471]|nr:hypothetical protein HD806DRAFT_524603 [Xylariaceae sp. AK1471]
MALPNRKACDRCHDLKLGCRRIDKGPCERCLKANQSCLSSPSLRHRKKRSRRGRESRNRGRPLQIRPGPPKVTGGTLIPRPEQNQLLCDSMSQSEQAPTASNLFSEPRVEKDIIGLPSPCSSGPEISEFQHEEAYDFHNFHRSNLLGCEDFQQPPLAAEVGLGYLELRLHQPSLDYSRFQDTATPEYPEQALLEYLSEVNLAHDAWQSLQRDTTCGDTCTGYWGLGVVEQACSSKLSVEELFHFSRRFSSTLDAMASAGTLTSCHIDPALVLSVYSRIRDIHDIIIQLTAQSLQLSKDAVVRITNWHKLYI